ncbi:hypothetical protein DL770_005260 [Monosporascus sp. CRB-9-2]|nr:hypothetical protein DL770_005260 [Monosporascus sp. CRB-9-2]
MTLSPTYAQNLASSAFRNTLPQPWEQEQDTQPRTEEIQQDAVEEEPAGTQEEAEVVDYNYLMDHQSDGGDSAAAAEGKHAYAY